MRFIAFDDGFIGHRESYIEIDLTKGLDLICGAEFLTAEIIARHTNNHQSLIPVAVI